jgi:F0F1-type ATP synthase membrane subunit b/b'
MTDVGFIAWWQIVIVLCFLWLFYVVIWRLLQGEIGSRTKLSEESLNSALEKGKKIAAS